MTPHESSESFRSTMRFQVHRVRAAAIYCSDGRYGDQFDEFLHECLGLPCYDRVALPGGAGAIAGHIESMRSEDALISEMEFLIRSHDLERIVLIAHEGCGYYQKRLLLPPRAVPQAQERDMCRAAAVLGKIKPSLEISAHLATVSDGIVEFSALPIRAVDGFSC